MFKKRTSKRYKRARDCQHMLHLNVNSPRILAFKSMGVFAGLAKVGVLIAMLCLAVWGAKQGVKALFTENQEYALKQIELHTNGSFTSKRIVEQTRIKAGSTLFAIDPSFMQEKLVELPEVVSATVSRDFPDTLRVELVERVPIAWIHAPYADLSYRDRENGLLVGEDGVLFPCEGEGLWSVSKNLPAIVVEKGEDFAFRAGKTMVHEEAMRALSLVKEHQAWDSGTALLTLTVVDFYTLVAEYSDEVIATFGMHDHERQLGDLNDIRKHASHLGKKIHWLDLRPKRNIPGQYKVSSL